MNLLAKSELYWTSGTSFSWPAVRFLVAIGYFPSFFEPYFDRACLRSCTPWESSTPRTMWYRTPGRSRTRPPRTSTIECSCRLCPSPGMYAVTSTLLDRRTRATLRRAEFGFLGVMILTCKHTPFFCGQPCSAGCFGRRYCCTRGLRTSWLMVGISVTFPVLSRPPAGQRPVGCHGCKGPHPWEDLPRQAAR